MRILWSCAVLALLGVVAPAAAAPVTIGTDANVKRYEIPYKTTIPKHIVVRAKINGKGPFNFILDTGAPALFVATAVGKKVGAKPNANGWATFDRFEIEGGLVIPKTKARIETPFQLEGMNGLGLAGVEIHGLMGYGILAQYRMEIDFTRDKMVWTPLTYKLEVSLPERREGAAIPGGLEIMGSIMKGIGGFLGTKPAPEVTLRGFYGLTLANGDENPVVEAVLEKGPAGEAGIKKGDIITRVQGRTVTDITDVIARTKNLPSGSAVKLTVKRGDKKQEITIKTSEGI
jgi:membrane-associated protease RseP (regulator of RpoE activity)